MASRSEAEEGTTMTSARAQVQHIMVHLESPSCLCFFVLFLGDPKSNTKPDKSGVVVFFLSADYFLGGSTAPTTTHSLLSLLRRFHDADAVAPRISSPRPCHSLRPPPQEAIGPWHGYR